MITATDILVFEIQQYPIHRDTNRLLQAKQSLLNIISFLPRLRHFFPELGEPNLVATILRVAHNIGFDLRCSDFFLRKVAGITE